MKGAMRNWGLSGLAVAVLAGCSASPTGIELRDTTPPSVQVPLAQPPQVSQPLTLNQIMANPDWMGILAKEAYWSDDSQSVLFARQASAAALPSYYQQGIYASSASELAIDKLHAADQQYGVLDPSKSKKAYLYQGNIFVKQLTTGKITQLTRQRGAIDGVRFLNNGDIAYWQGDSVFKIHLNTGLVEQLAEIKMAKAPETLQEPSSYLAKQQHRLIQYVALQQQHAQAKQQFNDELQKHDPTLAPLTWYLGDNEVVSELSLSPDGRYILLTLTDKNYRPSAPHDIMPNYLGAQGYIDPIPVRTRVAEDTPPGQRLLVLDLQEHKQTAITIEGLTGFDEDVLAKVKAENAAAKGEAYALANAKGADAQSAGGNNGKTPRKVQLMQDWGWSQSAIQWHDADNKVAVMVEATDNKDRWIATVDLTKGKLVTEHRLHDEAWVNYENNQFGWLPGTDTLYYLSEESGYSHLYLKAAGEAPRALTQGKFVVSDISLSPDAKYIYYKANLRHPGIYNVHRVELATAKNEQLTQWDGNLDYQLSPDGTKLLLNASRRTEPNELYVQHIGGQITQLTSYTSDAFKQYPWQAPEVVAVPSSHGAGQVYARVYLPQGYDPSRAEKYPAVIFNHGAGYLQNADYGFSGYFREFMFHNLLSQQGYVVLDMDYRGSKGYGRDWRTAIYRKMGHPEVEDLKDGVTWMANNAHVDIQRVGTYGGSYGGFLTFMALFTEPELFQAGAALRPVTDWAHYNAPYTSNILNTPDVDPIAYERSSPIEHAQGLTKPLLIMSGVLDDNVFFQDSVRLVQRLIELEKPMFETAIYPVEPHGFRQPSSWLDEYRRIYKLFEQELK